MARRATQILWAILAAGLVIRVALAFATEGLAFDINSLRIVAAFLNSDGLNVYGIVNAAEPIFRWPYPPGFFPAILAADGVASATSLPFHGLIQLPAIAADLGIAWLAQAWLGRRGAPDQQRLIAAALIALGPLFILISGYQGQIDSLAILPALAALYIWTGGGEGRARWAGLLVGVGIAIKIVPLVILPALLISARSRREAATLLAAAATVPIAVTLPFLLADPDGVAGIARYQGVPGFAGITLILQPELARIWLLDSTVEIGGLVDAIYNVGVIASLVPLALIAALIARHRPDPLLAVIAIWLTVIVTGTSFLLQYLVWLLPFLVIAERLRAAVAVQVVASIGAIIYFMAPWESETVLYVYVPLMIGLWLALGAMLINTIREVRSP